MTGGGRRVSPYWDTDFGRWVGDFGVSHIVDALGRNPELRVTHQAVYSWIRGHAPNPTRARELVRLSGGQITLDVIYRHAEEIKDRHKPCRST